VNTIMNLLVPYEATSQEGLRSVCQTLRWQARTVIMKTDNPLQPCYFMARVILGAPQSTDFRLTE
jgi:hypothetical protein